MSLAYPSNEILRALRQEHDGQGIDRCHQCGACTSACPLYASEPRFNPRHWFYLAKQGDDSALRQLGELPSRCLDCHRCSDVCPSDARPMVLLAALRRWIEQTSDESRPRRSQVAAAAWRVIRSEGRLDYTLLTEEVSANPISPLSLLRRQLRRCWRDLCRRPSPQWLKTAHALQRWLEQRRSGSSSCRTP